MSRQGLGKGQESSILKIKVGICSLSKGQHSPVVHLQETINLGPDSVKGG